MFYFLRSAVFLVPSSSFYSVSEAVVKQQCQPLVTPCVQDAESVKQQAGRGNKSK